MKIGIVAGEASGDALGAKLIHSLKEINPQIEFIGVGGKAMIAAGCHSLYNMESLSVMGLIEPLKNLLELIKIRYGLQHYFLKNKPDIFVGIDSPDFNLGLELKLKAAGIPTVHYVSPSVWAWRQKRVHKIAKATDLVLTLFPFEEKFYQKYRVPVKFVGHPLADQIPLQANKLLARSTLSLLPDVTYIAILPGSRRNEIKYLAETFIATAYRCWKMRPELRFLTSAANTKRHQEFKALCAQLAPTLPIQFFEGEAQNVMTAADVALVTSGTATLETMLCKCPMVIAYKMAEFTFQLGKHLVKIPRVGLPNLLADELLVPEFIQDNATPTHLASAILGFLDNPQKIVSLQSKFTELHQSMCLDASTSAAKAVLSLIR